ncbi:MAG: NUDIX domain-containing protein [Patescibacteria group bacterium]
MLKSGKDFIGIGVFALIKNGKGEILLTKAKSSEKRGKDYEGIWSMSGGTLEFGETCEEGLEREIMEELGINISDIKLLNYNDYIKDEKHWLALNFSAQTKEEARNMELEKNEEMKWFSLEDIPQNVSPYTKECWEILLA